MLGNNPLLVSSSFYFSYKKIYPSKQENKQAIKKRKVPVVGDFMQCDNFEDFIKDLDEVYFDENYFR